jgi:proline iminopeptidase
VIIHAGRKRIVFCVQNIDHHHPLESIPSALMASEQEISQVNRNLYPHIEPYSTGFLKVSDLHSIYWEQSGNPTGHVSSNCFPSLA